MILETERLILRLPVKTDFEVYAEMWARPDLFAHIPIKPQTPGQSWRRLMEVAGSWALIGYGNWLVFEKETSALIGQVGFFDASRGYGDGFDNHRESGWIITIEKSGKGFATEAMQAALKWFDAQDFGDTTVCGINGGHAASIRVAEKCGYRFFRTAEDELGEVQLMSRAKP